MDTKAADPDLKTTSVTPGPQTILVIEDDMSVQMFVAQVLKNAGYQVLAAADMQEAMNMSDVTAADIHLILTDIMLPGSNGMEIAEALVAKRPRTPVLYMSGAGSDAIHGLQFEGAPIGEFLHKPFSPEMLLGKIRAMVLDAAGEFAAQETATAALSPEAAALRGTDAVYRLESSVRCPHCNETISTLQAVRLLRMQVNFTSTLPRRGRALVCPSCGVIVSAELTTF